MYNIKAKKMKKSKKEHILLIDSIRAYSKDIVDAGKLDSLEPDYIGINKLTYKIKSLHFNMYLYPDGTIKYLNFFGSIPKYINGNNIGSS